jgi:hypothetical protein
MDRPATSIHTGDTPALLHAAAPWLLTGQDTEANACLRPSSSDTAALQPVFSVRKPVEVFEPSFAAPSPDTILAPRQHGMDAQDQSQASAALLGERHAAEVARLTQALHDAKQACAADIGRLRAQHAAEMQRMVEALWQAQDAARTVPVPPELVIDTPAPEPPPSFELQPARSDARLARLVGWCSFSPVGRACALLERIGRRWATAFRVRR